MGSYDPRHPNDRLLLGMKGTMSELELSLFRQRSQAALKQKARRGALFLGVAAGYVKSGRDRIEKDPDVRVREALRLVFSKFAELRSARQVHFWLREEGIVLPAKSRRSEAPGVVWKLPAYNAVHNILTNPIYAGALHSGGQGARSASSRAASTSVAVCAARSPNGTCCSRTSTRATSPGTSSSAINASSPIMRPAWGGRLPEGRYAKAKCFSQDSCVAVIAAASCRCTTAANSAAITAMAPA